MRAAVAVCARCRKMAWSETEATALFYTKAGKYSSYCKDCHKAAATANRPVWAGVPKAELYRNLKLREIRLLQAARGLGVFDAIVERAGVNVGSAETHEANRIQGLPVDWDILDKEGNL